MSHPGKSGAKSPWIWLSGAQKCHLGQMPAPCPPAGRLHSLFLELPEPFICTTASETLVAANPVTWVAFVLLVSRTGVIYLCAPFYTLTPSVYLAPSCLGLACNTPRAGIKAGRSVSCDSSAGQVGCWACEALPMAKGSFIRSHGAAPMHVHRCRGVGAGASLSRSAVF